MAVLAQSVEQVPCKHQVEGSSPSGSSSFCDCEWYQNLIKRRKAGESIWFSCECFHEKVIGFGLRNAAYC